MPSRFLLSAFIHGLLLLPLKAAEPTPIAFQPTGMWNWDNWFVHDGARWHAFYLQLPKAVGPDRRWKNNDFYKHVGHATSEDLLHWQDQGPALGALSGTWNDRHIATGSILKHDGRWWMFFTGRGTQGDGVGLALSDDLTTWKTEPEPLMPLIDTFADKGEKPFISTWQGQSRSWIGISDPYILPEPQDGWFYLVLCARVLDVPLAQSGCLAVVRSRDLRRWEAAGILAWPQCFERMETPQLWRHASRWYLSFGGVLDKAWVEKNTGSLPAAVQGRKSHENYCYTLPALNAAAPDDALHHIEIPPGNYIMKVLPDADGQEVALFTRTVGTDSGISSPYPVTYDANHVLQVSPTPKTSQ
jgi:beta-fructofuranosidase